jgi:hypothetical protein
MSGIGGDWVGGTGMKERKAREGNEGNESRRQGVKKWI